MDVWDGVWQHTSDKLLQKWIDWTLWEVMTEANHARYREEVFTFLENKVDDIVRRNRILMVRILSWIF